MKISDIVFSTHEVSPLLFSLYDYSERLSMLDSYVAE